MKDEELLARITIDPKVMAEERGEAIQPLGEAGCRGADQMVGIALGESPVDQSWPRSHRNHRGGDPQ